MAFDPNKLGSIINQQKSGGFDPSKINEIQNLGEMSEQQIEPSLLSKVSGIAKKVGGFIAKSEIEFGKSITGGIIPKTKEFQEFKESQQGLVDMQTKVLQKIKEKREKGEDFSQLIEVLQDTGALTPDNEINPALDKTTKQIIGEALGVVADIASAGIYGKLAKGAKTGQLLVKAPKIAPIAKTSFEAVKQGAIKGAEQGAIFGGAYGASGALQENEDLGGIIKRTLTGGATGGVIGGVIGGIANRKNIDPEELRQQAIEKYKLGLRATKEKFKERADKVIPELLDAKVWGTRKQLIDKADKGIKLSLNEYEELGKLKGMISTEGLLGKIDDEVMKLGKEVIEPETGEKIFRAFSINEEKVNTLRKLKADIVALDAFDKVKDNQAYQQELRELAQFYGADLYESRKAMKTITDSKTLSQVKKVDSAIRELLNTNNPEYAKINEVYHRNSELYDILQETVKRESSGLGVKRILQTLGTVIGVGAGVASGNISLAVGGGVAMGSLLAILNSTWWNTLRAVQKNNLAEKLIQKGASQIPNWLMMIERQGIKAVEELLAD